jgi:threonine-phosphate decarboxylase
MPLEDIVAIASGLFDVPTIVIDESFIDFSGLESATTLVERLPNVVVVKSMGKSLGWHGVRLGYAAANRQRAALLRQRLPFWNINGVAAFVLRNLAEFQREYAASFAAVAADRGDMTARLSSIRDLTVYPSHANFLFAALPPGVSGRTLRDRLLAHHGMLVRETSNNVGSSEQYLRFAVLQRSATEALERALRIELTALVGARRARRVKE